VVILAAFFFFVPGAGSVAVFAGWAVVVAGCVDVVADGGGVVVAGGAAAVAGGVAVAAGGAVVAAGGVAAGGVSAGAAADPGPAFGVSWAHKGSAGTQMNSAKAAAIRENLCIQTSIRSRCLKKPDFRE